jgi:hypothetical protein
VLALLCLYGGMEGGILVLGRQKSQLRSRLARSAKGEIGVE